MQTTAIVLMLLLFAVALIPVSIGYYLWLARSIVPRTVALPPLLARTALALCVALPWIAIALVLWSIRR
jgi:hypothetical protein